MTNEDHDRAAYLRRLALDSLSSYRGGFAELERIDRDLKSIVRALSDIAEAPWARSLVRLWGQLEIIYACALNDGRHDLTSREEAEIQVVITDLVAGLQPDEQWSACEAPRRPTKAQRWSTDGE